MTPKPHERLASAIEDRRSELGLSLREVAQLADITGETLRAVRKGSNDPSPLTRRGIEKALDWKAGSVAAVLAGGEPTVADRSTSGRGIGDEEEDQFARMDRLYEKWKQDPERRQALWTILRSGEEKDAG